MSYKDTGVYRWLMEIYNHSEVTTDDIDFIGGFFHMCVGNAYSLHQSSKKVETQSIKDSLNVLALEEISKPPIVSDIIPIPGEKWDIEKEIIKDICKTLTDHQVKQSVSGVYGTRVREKYDVNFSEEEVDRLEKIKQNGFYTDITYEDGQKVVRSPFGSKDIDTDLSDKLARGTEERVDDFAGLYAGKFKSIAVARVFAIKNIFQFPFQYMEFLEDNDFLELSSYQDILKLAKEYTPDPLVVIGEESEPDPDILHDIVSSQRSWLSVTDEIDDNFIRNEAEIMSAVMITLASEGTDREVDEIREDLMEGSENSGFISKIKNLFK